MANKKPESVSGDRSHAEGDASHALLNPRTLLGLRETDIWA